MANPKLSTLTDAFSAGAINTALWSNITAGAASLDTVNDLVVLQQPTTSGAVNTFGSNSYFDATSSAIYAEVTPSANGNGHTNTIFKLFVDANDSIAIRLASGVLEVTQQTAGTTVTTTLTTYNPNLHGWWRLRELSGTIFADVSPDGYNWTTLYSSAYTWAATAMQFVFQTSAGATEASGNVATIQHVNSMVVPTGQLNINWPASAEDWAPHWNSNGGDTPLDRYVSLNKRTRQQSSVTRGKQYELDQCRAGEATAVLSNADGVLDPLNSAGPYFGHIMPYQPWRRRAMWPPCRNLLSQVMATAGNLGGQPLGTINAGEGGPDIFSVTDSTGGSFVSSATAWTGDVCMQFAVPTTQPNQWICYTPQVAVDTTPATPGNSSTVMPYSNTLWVRNITASTTVQVNSLIQWLDVNQTPISSTIGTYTTITGSTSAAWTQVTVTGVPPSNAAMMYVGVCVVGTPASAVTVQVGGWQLEQAAAVSAWACPGQWYGLWAGGTENWQATWDKGGTYGLVTPSGVDVMGALSQVTLTDPLTQEITNNSPRFLYQLADPSGSGSATDTTGNYPAIYATSGKYGAGSLVFGTTITAASTAGLYTGSTGTVMTLANPDPGTNLLVGATFLSLGPAGITGPASAAVAWSRMLAFRYTAGSNPTAQAIMWSGFDQANGNGSVLHWAITSSGSFEIQMAGPGGSGYVYPISGSSVADSNWHLAIVTYSGSAAQLTIYLDGVGAQWSSIGTSQAPVGLVSDNIGAFCDSVVGNGTTYNFQGDLSYCAEFPSVLSPTAAANLYSAWRSACAGESSTARYSRILRYAGYTGVTNLQTGLTTDMGPALDIAGSDALSCLQAVVDSENGQHFVDVNGTVTFQARSARYNATMPVYTFGENIAGGEWPYEDVQLSLDPTQISNIVQITQDSSSQAFTAQDSVSQTDYFPRTLQRTINVESTLECQAAAQYLVSRYKQPATRIASMVLHPSANPSMWPVCLSLELGMRIQVNRRPPFAPMIEVPCFIEAINWQWDDTGEATVTLQCSPVDTTPYGIFASFHTTLASTIAANAGSITINAGADDSNPAASQISTGQQIVLSLGTANQETVTVKGVAATSSGWSTCVITLQANTANPHTAGDVVCEPLPTGVTSASTYDASSVMGSVALCY